MRDEGIGGWGFRIYGSRLWDLRFGAIGAIGAIRAIGYCSWLHSYAATMIVSDERGTTVCAFNPASLWSFIECRALEDRGAIGATGI